MGEVLHADFGSEREWEDIYLELVDGLVAVGASFGDDESLMRAKADCAYRALRQIVEDMPAVEVSSTLPVGLLPEQLEALTEVVKQASIQGTETAMIHSVEVLASCLFDLCTSKLA